MMAEALIKSGLAEEPENDSSPQLASVDERMRYVLTCLKQENSLKRAYDYVWIMRYINEEHITGMGVYFYSVKSFRDYVTQYLGITDVAGLSTLSRYYSSGKGKHPEWTFTDTKDATERLRRLNVAKRFSVIWLHE